MGQAARLNIKRFTAIVHGCTGRHRHHPEIHAWLIKNFSWMWITVSWPWLMATDLAHGCCWISGMPHFKRCAAASNCSLCSALRIRQRGRWIFQQPPPKSNLVLPRQVQDNTREGAQSLGVPHPCKLQTTPTGRCKFEPFQ